VSSTEFQGTLNSGLFKTLVPDPRRLEGKLAKYNADLAPTASVRANVQRLIQGAKKRNVEPYANYIINMVKTGEGFTPQIVLWCEGELRVETDANTGLAWILVPHDVRFVALDGDTQTTARNLANERSPGLLDKEKIKIVIKHGTPEGEAQQIFAVSNSQGVKVSTSMAIGLDNRDDATQFAKFLERKVAALSGKVNRQKRQLSSGDDDVLTISALRASAVCFAEGISGIQNQTKAVTIDESIADHLREAAVIWYNAATWALNGAMTPDERAKTFGSAPAVWSAIGALGHDVYVDVAGANFENSFTPGALEHAFKHAAETKLRTVDWSRGAHWQIAGAKASASGAVTLGGPKETGSLVYKAIKEGSLSTKSSAVAA